MVAGPFVKIVHSSLTREDLTTSRNETLREGAYIIKVRSER